jgi:hypothetical protein
VRVGSPPGLVAGDGLVVWEGPQPPTNSIAASNATTRLAMRQLLDLGARTQHFSRDKPEIEA